MRRWVGVGAGLVVAFVVWRGIALAGYRAAGARLVARAGSFPREYRVGRGRPLRLVVLGDSTAMGVGADRVEETLPYRFALGQRGRVSVLNLAASGARALDVVRGQLERITKGADVVLVSLSANDATHGTPPPDLERDLRTILDRLRELGVVRAVVSTTPNFRTTPALPFFLNRLSERRAATLTGSIRRVAAAYPFVRLADVNAEGTLDEAQYAADGFHPNAAGYRLWGSIFLRATTSGLP